MSKGAHMLFPGLSEESPFSFKKRGSSSVGWQQQLGLFKKEAEVGGEESLYDERNQNHTLSLRMQKYRNIITSDNWLFAYTRYTIYVLYVLHVALVAAKVTLGETDPDPVDTDSTADTASMVKLASWVSFCAWMILIILNSTWMIVMGGWQYVAWHGRRVMILHGFQALIFILFILSIESEFSVVGVEFDFGNSELYAEYALLLVMGFYLFVREQMVLPITTEQKLVYAGYVSKEHKDSVKEWFETARVDDPELYDHVTAPQTSEHLIESFESARIDLDISLDVPIREALKGQNLRASGPPGSIEFQERNDDLVLVIYKLSKLVSLAPKCCRRKTQMTSLQYRNLIRQNIMDTYYPDNTLNNKRTLPLSSAETFLLMLKFSMKVRWSYLNSQVPNIISGIAQPAAMVFYGNLTTIMTNGGEDKRGAYMNFGLLLFFMSVLFPVMTFWNTHAKAKYTAKMGNVIRRDMMHGVVNGGTKYGELNGNGELMDAFSAHLAKLEIFALGLFNSFWAAIASLAASIVVAVTSYPFGAVLFLSLGPVVLSFGYFADKASTNSYRQATVDARFASRVTSIVECRQAIRACDSATWIQETSSALMENVEKAHGTNYFSAQLLAVMLYVYTQIFALFILIPLGYLVINGKQNYGGFVTIFGTIMSLQGSITFLGMLQSEIAIYSGSLQSIDNLMDKSLMETTSTSKSSPKTKELSILSQQLAADELAFKYEGMDRNVLENLNLSFPKGKYVVLTGGSGSGKSTILKLLMRFAKPKSGIIKWDGTDISSVTLESFRKKVAVMFQETMIYEATIRDNILFGKEETHGGVEKAAIMAEIHSSIRDLPNGYDTLIGGDSVVGMSGGQMQRICLARALYRKPSVLLLDEATSALDAKTEKEIIATLCELRDKKNMTIVSVSHHPSTGVNADRIIVLEKGSLAEDGTYNELMSIKGGIFKELAESQ